MKEKFLNKTITALKIVSFAIFIFGLASLMLVFFGGYAGENVALSLVYMLFGFIFTPIYLLFPGISGRLNLLIVVACLVFMFLAITLFLSLSFVKKSKKVQLNKGQGMYAFIGAIMFMAYFIFSLVILLANRESVLVVLESAQAEFVVVASKALGMNMIELVYYIVLGIVILISTLAVISFAINIEKNKKEKVRKSLLFYSEEFEEKVEQPVKAEQEKTEEVFVDTSIPEGTKAGKQLVEKIMMLNKMKESGEISAVEYTRLRQKAIRRYK